MYLLYNEERDFSPGFRFNRNRTETVREREREKILERRHVRLSGIVSRVGRVSARVSSIWERACGTAVRWLSRISPCYVCMLVHTSICNVAKGSGNMVLQWFPAKRV